MSTHADATFKIDAWDEEAIDEAEDGPQFTRASVRKTYDGAIQGRGTVEYLMMYREDGSAAFVGLELVTGRLAGRSGSFVLQHVGAYTEGTAAATVTVVDDSGGGDLRGLQGQGGYAAGHQEPHHMTLDYDLE